MPHQRLPRFERAQSIRPIRITARDRDIISLVHRHRFLSSKHLELLLGGSRQVLLRRLHLLFHHGYLERPRSQIEYFGKGGSRPIAYGLGNKGAKILGVEAKGTDARTRWSEKNQSVGEHFLRHALLITDVMVAIELELRERPGTTLLHEDLLAMAGKHRRMWRVKVNRRVLGIMPDRTFAIGFEGPQGIRQRVYFYVEADRGTMPVVRKNLTRTSIYRKLVAYQATWSQGMHRTDFGIHRFRVLFVTTGPTRQQSIIDASAQLKSGRGLFLFSDAAAIASRKFVSTPLPTGNPGETSTILP